MICGSAARAVPDTITKGVIPVRRSGMTFMGDMSFPLLVGARKFAPKPEPMIGAPFLAEFRQG